jgi:hypothetical protein
LNLTPDNIETISTVRKGPGYIPSFKSFILGSKDKTLEAANFINDLVSIRVYLDGSGFEGGIGASAVLYIED